MLVSGDNIRARCAELQKRSDARSEIPTFVEQQITAGPGGAPGVAEPPRARKPSTRPDRTAIPDWPTHRGKPRRPSSRRGPLGAHRGKDFAGQFRGAAYRGSDSRRAERRAPRLAPQPRSTRRRTPSGAPPIRGGEPNRVPPSTSASRSSAGGIRHNSLAADGEDFWFAASAGRARGATSPCRWGSPLSWRSPGTKDPRAHAARSLRGTRPAAAPVLAGAARF